MSPKPAPPKPLNPKSAPAPAPFTVAESIVLRALLRIGKHFVRFVDFLEAMLGFHFVGRYVGMVLARKRAIRAFDIVSGRFSSDAEDFVIILGGHVLRFELSLFDFDVGESFG